ncbi:hypothetical protein ASG72_14045 [Bosea sp. Leaf344]|uniref:winged helix-turn-helix domain-containing protein n=1 Tax=Bosea sp. Leaf344 TaxID=1736346 RepID=UPI0006FCD1DB|nr:LysR family transcriptional regulator [Bosea sp. Leaf344]KQU50937.1 hypothetical protein ASG72_14045 [Bosea sp. Leaf344]
MAKPEPGRPRTRLSLRIDIHPAGRLGPGKIDLLEAIEDTGSISAAGRAMGMSYRRAWLLIDSLNGMFRQPLVEAASGGAKGGGAALTPLGREVVAHYRAIEARIASAAGLHLRALEEAAIQDAPGEAQASPGV